jgi:hypothetical protein
MIRRTIQNINRYRILDELTNDTYYGGNQEWYKKKWQRLSGCGPTVVSNIIYYIDNWKIEIEQDDIPYIKKDFIDIMEEIWKYVTPTFRGIPSTIYLMKGITKYKKAKNLSLELSYLDIPKKKEHRPELKQILKFLDEALQNNTPVAFLNLNNGEEKQLDAWHWVTLVTLEYEEDGSFVSVDILDEGLIKKVNLLKWLQTTTLGGGFVRFHSSNMKHVK